MGGSQSQERVIGVEERPGDGQPQIIVTEDFMRHIHDKQQQDSPGGSDGSRPETDQQEEELEEDELQYIQSAEDLLMGEQVSDGGYESQQKAYGVPEDNRWKKKYELERQKNQDLKNLNSEAFDQAVNEVRDKFASKTRDIVMPVCEDCRDKVDDCYNRYPGKPLQCSSLVKEYIQCVEKHRKGLLQPGGD